MTSGRGWTEALLWVVACSCLASLARTLRVAPPEFGELGAPAQALASTPVLWSPDSLMAWADRVSDAPPFRLDRQLVQPGMPEPVSPSGLVAPDAPRLSLVLQGIVGRTGHWEAVIAGVPGESAGVLVQAGDSLAGGLRVRRIGADTVVVAARDTTFTLVVRRAWP